MGGTYHLQQASEYYPRFSTSNDIQEANGILGFTFEVGDSFKPPPEEIAPTVALVNQGTIAFIDAIRERGLR